MECIFNLGDITAGQRFEVVNSDVFPAEKQTGTALFSLHTTYHVQHYIYRSTHPLITQSFKIVGTPVNVLF